MLRKSVASNHVVVCQEWIESERGWGTRPDGYSLHLTESACKDYIKLYWSTMPDEVPDEYSRPNGEAYKIKVDAKTYDELVERGFIRSYSGNVSGTKV